MKLLIVTQKVDVQDPILGFFHRWIEEFAAHCESVVVIGHSVGEHSLPSNVTVESLQKEQGSSKFSQVMRFRSLIKKYSDAYDCTLVHMTPIWIVLGAGIWRRHKKAMYLWYEARGKRWPLRIALRSVRKVFSASKHGMPIQTSKSIVVKHGIDTEKFAPSEKPHDPHAIISVGRITKSKHPEQLVRALKDVPSSYELTLIGNAITEEDRNLSQEIQRLIENLGLSERIHMQTLTHDALVPVLQQSSLFLHASDTPLDKAVLEAMACGCLVVSCAEAVTPILPSALRASRDSLGTTAANALLMSPSEQQHLRNELRSFVVTHHSLKSLIPRLLNEMSPVA